MTSVRTEGGTVAQPASRNGLFYAAPAAALLLLLILPAFVKGDYYLHVLVNILFFAYMASAWNIVCGYTGQLSLGHSALCGIGGYISTLLFINLGLSPWLGMLVGGACATVVGVLIGYPCFRLRGPYFTLTTIAFAEILRIWAENTEEILGIELRGAQGISVPLKGHHPLLFQFDGKVAYFYVILAMLVMVLAVPITAQLPAVVTRLPSISAISPAETSLTRNLAQNRRQSVQAPRRSPL